MKQTFEPGQRVLITHNPHESGAEGILGTVVSLRPREGFGRADLFDVEYDSPREGSSVVMPFGAVNLSEGEPRELLAAAERLEKAAAEMRALAEGPRSDQPCPPSTRG